LQQRQVGLGAGQPLGAPPAADGARPAGSPQLAQEVLGQGGLADARLAGDAQEMPPAGRRRLEARAQPPHPPRPAPGRARGGGGGVGGGGGGAAGGAGGAGVGGPGRSAASTSAAVGRSRGSLASIRRISTSRGAGSSGFRRPGGTGSCSRMACRMPSLESASN